MADVSDKITDTRNATRPVSTTVASPRAAGGGTLTCASLTGWPTASKVHGVTYQIDSNSNPVAGSQQDFSAIVSGSNLTSFTVIDGTDTGNSIGDIVEMLPTSAWGQDLSDALTTSHNRNGTPKSGITYPASTFTTPTITDFSNMNHTHASIAQGGPISNVLMSNPYKFRVYRNSTQNIASGGVLIQFDTKNYDTGSNVDIVTNKGRFTAPIAGFYFLTAGVQMSTGAFQYQVNLYKNGSQVSGGNFFSAPSSSFANATATDFLQLSANDYIEVFAYTSNPGGANVTGNSSNTFFAGYLVSAT